MKTVKILGLTMICGLLLVGCSNDGQETGRTTVPAKNAENTKKNIVAESTEEQNVETFETTEDLLITNPSYFEYAVDWSEDWNGLKISIDNVKIVKFNTQEEADEFEAEGEGAIGVNFIVENNSDFDLDTYPDQATMVVNGQQIEANMFMSDNVGGEILSGVQKEGIVTFDIPKMEDPEAINNIRLKWSASNWNSDDMDNGFKDFDVTIELK